MVTIEERVKALEDKVNAILLKMADQDPGWADEYAGPISEWEAEKGEAFLDFIKRKYLVDVEAMIGNYIKEAIEKVKKMIRR